MGVLRGLFALGASAALSAVAPAVAHACGGCFAPSEAQVVVTDHRMAFAIHARDSVLWDQIRYAGRPEDFAWVLPVFGQVRVEVGSEAFFSLLDAATAVRVVSPPFATCCCRRGDPAQPAEDRDASGVTVLDEAVVGPYQTATLRSTDAAVLARWLRGNGYAIPPAVEPVIAWYVARRADFVALRLRPGQGVAAMQPVRVHYVGATTALPLRMITAGAGDAVGLTLWVIAQARYEAANFANAEIDAERLVWDWTTRRSNYPAVFRATLASMPGGVGWITESSMTDEVAQAFASGEPARLASDDWQLATEGGRGGFRVTRLRTVLPSTALDADLQLQVAARGDYVSSRRPVNPGHDRGPRPVTGCLPEGVLVAQDVERHEEGSHPSVSRHAVDADAGSRGGRFVAGGGCATSPGHGRAGVVASLLVASAARRWRARRRARAR